MQQTAGPSATDREPWQDRSGIRLKVWIAFLACCILAGWLKASQNRNVRQEYEAARAARQQEAARRYPLGEKALKRIRDLYNNGLDGRKPISRRRLEEELNQRRPFSLESDNGRPTATWVDPPSGRIFRLHFHHGQWTGFGTSWGSAANLPPVPPPQNIYQDGREQVRKLVAAYGPILWLLSLVVLVVFSALRETAYRAGARHYTQALQPHCRLLAEVLLALAIVCTMAWLVNPTYPITLQGVTSNDNLAIGTIMLLISVPVLAGVTPAPVRDEAEAGRPWQYSLRTLLMVTTLCAVTFALAPLGYIVAMYAVGGAALYAFVRVLTAATGSVLRS